MAGHTVTPWGGILIIIGGHVKVKDAAATLTVRTVDTANLVHSAVAVAGPPPPARGCHTSTLIGGKVYVFGGEDGARRPLNDLHVLDLSAMCWQHPKVLGHPPPPRSAHTAAAYLDRYLVVFGGGSEATCFGDVHVLDTVSGAARGLRDAACMHTGSNPVP